MKKIKKILFILISIFVYTNVADAKAVSIDEIPNESYVIGSYLLTRDDNEIYNTENMSDNPNKIYDEYEGLNDQTIMLAASSIKNPNFSNMIIYYKNYRGAWRNGTTGEAIEVGDNFEITHVNGVCMDSSCMGDEFKITFEAQEYEKDVFQTKEIYLGYGDKITSAQQPTLNNRPGYKFVCWTIKGEYECFDFNISITDDGTRIPEGGRELTLEIKWEQIGYKVTYDSNFQGGSSTTLDECHYYDETNPNNCKFALYDSLNISENSGYRFLGWALTPDGKTIYQPETEMSIILGNEEEITLYAIWSARDYQIKYDLNGGTFNVNDEVTNGFDSETEKIVLFTPTRVGYKFTGWTLNGKAFDGTDFPRQDLLVKANWEKITYSFTYNNQEKKCTYDERCELDFTTTEKAGQDFLGLYLEDGSKLPSYVINFTTEDGKNYVVEDKYATIKYTISYDYRGGSVSINNPTEFEFRENGVNNIQLFSPEREGYNFAGYEIEGPATIGEDKKTLTINEAGSIKVTAKWTAIEFSFTYNGETKTCQYDQKCTLEFKEPVVEGKEFKYWYYIENGGLGNKVRIDNNVTNYTSVPATYNIEAEMGDITYNISYNYNGGVVSTPNKVEYTVTETTIPLTEPTKKGYKFVEWKTSENAEITDNNLVIKTSGNVTLEAIWEPIQYTLKHNDKTQTCTYDTECQIEFTADDIAGKTFSHWYIGEGASAKIISNYVTNLTSNEEEIEVKASYTLNKYRVKYDLDGGVMPNDVENTLYVEYDSDKENIYTLVNPTKLGYTFKGWAKSDESNVEIAGNKMTVTAIGEIKLVAEWTPVNVTINYYEENDVVYGSANTCAYNECTIITEHPEKEGYIFDGWRTENGLVYQGGSSITSDETYVINLYAKWTKEYRNTISYDLAGGNIQEGNLPTSYVDNETIVIPGVTKVGYTFKGWKMNNTTLELNAEGNTEITNSTGDINLVAEWEENKYTISFNYNGTEIGKKECSYDTPCELGEHTIDDEDVELIGWALEEKGPLYYGDNITIRNLTTEAEEITLYAVTRELVTRYTITYELDGGEMAEDAITSVVAGKQLDKLPTATKEGFEFAGWFYADNDEPFVEGTTITSSIVLKAKWSEVVSNVYNIDYESGYGEVELENATTSVKEGGTITQLPSVTPVEGYNFMGWKNKEDLEGEFITPETIINSSMTLVAIWEPITE